MKKLLLNIFLIILFPCLTTAQAYIPYRVGNLFGISDEQGKMILPAKFDKIVIGYDKDFTGISKVENQIKTSYILNNKVLISNSDYTYFEKKQDFIIAIKVNDPDSYERSNGNPDYLTQKLFNLEGQELLGRSYQNIIVVEDQKTSFLTGSSLLLLYDRKERYSLVLFDKKQKKITKTYFQNSYDVDTDYDLFPKSFSIDFNDQAGTKKKLILEFENGKIKSEKTEAAIKNRGNNITGSSYGMPPPPPGIPRKEPKPSIPAGALENLETATSYDYIITPADPEILRFIKRAADFKYAYLKKENSKIGYFLADKNTYLIPPKYDGIYLTEGHGVFYSGFVLKNNNQYQILVTSDGKQEFITAPFDLFPLYDGRDYGRKGFQLIKLFDKDNKFFCYANSEGKLYYTK